MKFGCTVFLTKEQLLALHELAVEISIGEYLEKIVQEHIDKARPHEQVQGEKHATKNQS
jgi:hypothetical protein